MKKKFIHVGKRTLSVVLSIMMIVSTMLIGTITSVSALDVSNATFYFVKPDGWTNAPRLVIGNGSNRTRYESDYNIDNKVYAFTGITWEKYDGFYFADITGGFASESGDYYYYRTGVSNVTSKIQDTASGYLYKLNSGTSGAVTGTNDLNDKISAKVYLKSGDTFTENSSIASASASGKKIDNTTSPAEAAKYSSPTFTTSVTDSSYSFVGWYDSTNTKKVSSAATYNLPELTTDTELHAVYEATTTTSDWFIYGAKWDGSWSDYKRGQKLSPVGGSTALYSVTLSGTYLTDYFNFHNGTNQYIPDSGDESTLNNGSANKTKIKTGNNVSFKNESQSSDDVTVYLDASDTNNITVWYETTATSTVKVTYGVHSSGGGTLSATSGDSGSTVTSGSSVTFTASPTDSTYTVEGWYSNADCTSDSKISDAGTSTSYTIDSVTADTTVYVKFTSTSQPVGNAPVLHKYDISASGDGSIASSGATDLLNVAMTYYTDSKYTYYYYDITAGGKYLYNITLGGVTYYEGNTTTYENSVYMNNSYSGWTDIFETGYNVSHYYIIYTPSLAADQRISVVTELPNSSASKTYKVTMEQGITSRRDGAQLGSSYLDGVTTQTTVAKSVEELTVTFTTQTVKVENPTYNDLDLGYTGYMYQVYGYSINMKLDNGDSTTSTRVASVVNNLVDSNSAKPISALANGVYTCEYTFPSNIKSATVTPIFSVSADYAKEKSITYTAVYLKMTPGSNLFSNTYEPKYYTWRAEKRDADVDNGEPMFVEKNGRVLEREPEGAYGGQKMLSVGTDMYLAYVQSDLYGILFDDYPNSSVQTFDYNEFIKLQQLGYNNITFEPKGDGSSETVASGLNTTYASNGTKVYTDSDQSSQTAITISDTALNNEFELDVDIEGYYIDVFGNRLQDTSGKDIKRSDLLADSSAATVKDELAALLTKTGKSNKLFGARYGAQDRKNTTDDYGMQFAVYNYYVDGTSMKLISQQVSGYGTIEGAVGPNSSSMTNAAYMASLSTPMTYRAGTASSNKEEYFSTGYELISSDYVGVPYLVSYKLKSDGTRVDGKWYYMSRTPQVTVNVKTSLLNDNGSLDMADDKIVENTIPGTATVNYKSFDTIDQGTSAVMRATPNEGFAFVGFYEENGDFISKYNPYGNKVFAVDTTVYAVFKEVGNGSITITNNIYDSAKPNPTPGGGNGKVSVTLVITPWNKTYDEQGNPVYGTPVTYTGETSVSATIQDGDLFHIVLTGERSGADNFLAFRMPDKDNDGNIYYVALVDAEFLNVKTDTNGKAKSAIYTTADMVWDWTKQLGTTVTSETKKAKTFSYYTDFSKTDINATLEYRYKDRFGNWKTYIVKNVPMNVSQINEGNYVPADSLVLQYAPPIDEVFNSCSWTAANIDARNSYALLEADQTYKTFNTYVDRNADGKYSLEEKDNERIVAQFNESIQIEAPETKGNATFKYWKRYLLDSTGAKGSGEIFSNMRSISIKVTFDSVFEPVYDEVSDTYFTNVQDAKYTREKSTDDKGVVHDYVYADFLLQFDTLEGNDTFKNIVASNPGKIKFGVILEMDYNYTYKPTPDKPYFTAPTTDNDLLKETIKNLNTGLAEGGHKSGWNATTDSKLDQYNYYYNLYDLTDKASNLSNFGRYDYFFKFANTEANRARVYNVYSYIIYTDSDRNEQIVVSKPKTLSIYATGIKNDGETA